MKLMRTKGGIGSQTMKKPSQSIARYAEQRFNLYAFRHLIRVFFSVRLSLHGAGYRHSDEK